MRPLSLLFLLSLPAAAFAADPLCANHQGIKKLNPFGSNALGQIKPCLPLYCGAEVKDEIYKARLKRIDEQLDGMQKATAEYAKAFRMYKSACQELMKDFGQASEKMQVVRLAYYNLEKAATPAADRYAELQSDRKGPNQELSNVELFTRTGEAAEKEYRNPACKKAINETTILRLNQNDAITKELEELECAPKSP